MNSSLRSRAPRKSVKLAAIAIFAGSLLLSALPAQAQPAARNGKNLHQIVASDGSQVAENLSGAIEAQGASFVPSASGTGARASGPSTITNDQRVAPATPAGSEASTESIIGTDNRYRITSTTSYPYRAIAHITSSIGGCSGWLIGRDTVMTAGHCIHNGSWATNVRVYPGRNGSSTPYGYCTARRLYSVVGWTSYRNRDYDYAAIKLNCTVGNTTGWFGFRWQSSSLTGQAAYTAGYPGDKSYGTMWRSNDQVRITQTRRLYYANDTYGGQSGSPVWNGLSSCNPCGIAIHAYGRDGTGYNGGTRITQEVFNNMVSWKNAA